MMQRNITKLSYLDSANGSGEEVRKAAIRISDYPEAWSTEKGDVRKYILHNFPYKLLYSIEESHIFIIAVAHQHRKPDYRFMDNEGDQKN